MIHIAWDDTKTTGSTLSATEWNNMVTDQKTRITDITGEVINDLSDVTITTVADNEVLAYDTTASAWINQTSTEAGLQTTLTFSTGLSESGGTITTDDSQIVHDNLSGFVANEHIDHTSVTLTAGTGLTGGGTIAANRTFNVDVGITDDKIVQIDDTDAASGDYAKFTTTGIQGRSTTEVLTDLGLDSELTNLSTAEIDYLEAIYATGVTSTEYDYLDGVTSNLQTQLNAKAPIADPTFTGEIGIGSVNVSETELGILEGATLTTTELNYVDGVTSAIQTQLNTKLENVSEDTTPQLGGNLDWNGKALFIAGQTVAGADGNLVYLSGADTWSVADADAEASCSKQLGIRLSSTTVLTHGIWTTTGLTAGSIYYASTTAGGITTTAPSATGDIVRIVGTALTTTELFFNPDTTFVEVA